MRRILALLLLLVLLLPLASCGADLSSEEEIRTAATALIESSLFVNEVFLGEGIPAEEHAFDGYLYADGAWMEEHGVYTVEELLARASLVYTEEVVAMLSRFASLDSEEEMPHYRNRTVERGLLVLEDRKRQYEGLSFSYRTDGIEIAERRRDRAVVTLSVSVWRTPAEKQERTLRLPMVLGEDGWRLDKITYVAYEDVD